MTTLRRYAYVAFGVACTHLVFGAIVRISGSGMGCGDHWPRCYGRWFPPLNRPDLVIEVSHRYLASILLLSLIALLVAAWRRRHEPGVAGPGGVLRPAALAVGLGFSAALLGALTVKLGNIPFATLAHWTVAMSLVATVVAAVIRAGGLGGVAARAGGASAKSCRVTAAGAAIALLAVVLGGLTAKYPGASVACPSFPLCGDNPDVAAAARHIQLTHRVLAVLLVLHLFGVVMALRKRREAAIVRRAAAIAFGLGVLQLLVAGAMIGMRLPPVLRSLHEATGVSIWIATFALALLARVARDGSASAATQSPVAPTPVVDEPLDAGAIRAATPPRQVFSSAIAELPASVAAVDSVVPYAPESWQPESIEPLPATGQGSFAVAQDDCARTHAVIPSERSETKDPLLPATGPGSFAVAQDDSATAHAVILSERSESKDLRPAAEIVAIEAPAPQLVPPARATMRHSVAVIVARGADF